MTPPERAAEAPPQVGAPQSVAQTGAAEHHAAPVPQPTAGAVVPDHAAPAVTHGWATALTGLCAHWVPKGGPRGVLYDRQTGLTLEGYDAYVDPLGLEQGAELPKCPACKRRLAAWTPPKPGHRS
jgi:hypothetical protein